MTPKLVLHESHRRTTAPIGGTAILWLLLDRLQLPGWVGGMAWTLWAIIWIVVIVDIVRVTKGRVVKIKREALEFVDD